MTIKNEVFFPDDVSFARPLLITLHGGGRDSQSQLDLWKPLATAEKFIVFAPNSLPAPSLGAAWLWPDNGQHLADKVSEALKYYPVDRRRIYCFGHSAGATKALDWGFNNRHLMAAVALHSPMQAQGIYQLNGGAGARRLPVPLRQRTIKSDFSAGVLLLF
jgi:poly(3-hydroxybutyrate) depolymerase